jgi:dipeptide transport system permease protein
MNPMFRFLIGRLALLVPTFLGVTIVAFGFIRLLPGDPVLLLAGERGITEERYNQLMEQFGFSTGRSGSSIWDYLTGAAAGRSRHLHRHQEAGLVTEFFTLFPATLELSLCAIILAVAIGIPAG